MSHVAARDPAHCQTFLESHVAKLSGVHTPFDPLLAASSRLSQCLVYIGVCAPLITRYVLRVATRVATLLPSSISDNVRPMSLGYLPRPIAILLLSCLKPSPEVSCPPLTIPTSIVATLNTQRLNPTGCVSRLSYKHHASDIRRLPSGPLLHRSRMLYRPIYRSTW